MLGGEISPVVEFPTSPLQKEDEITQAPRNLNMDFEEDMEQFRDILEIDDDEEEEIQKKQSGVEAVQRFIPLEIPEKVSEALTKLFYEDGFTVGRDQLWDLIQEELPDEKVPRSMVADWLERQELYQLYRKTRKSRGVSRFKMTSPFQRMSVDLIDYSNKPSQGNFRYAFVLLDNYSRYLFTKPIKTKKPESTSKAMQEIIDEVKESFDKKIIHVLGDRGGEFGKVFQLLLRKNNISSSKTIAGQASSNSMVERSNGSLKRILAKYKAIYGGDWKTNLKRGTDIYNGLKNDNSGFRPNEAVKFREGSKEFVELKENTVKRQEARKPLNQKRQKPLLVGDVVRVKIPKGVLDKASTPNWSKTLYIIKDKVESDGKICDIGLAAMKVERREKGMNCFYVKIYN